MMDVECGCHGTVRARGTRFGVNAGGTSITLNEGNSIAPKGSLLAVPEVLRFSSDNSVKLNFATGCCWDCLALAPTRFETGC